MFYQFLYNAQLVFDKKIIAAIDFYINTHNKNLLYLPGCINVIFKAATFM